MVNSMQMNGDEASPTSDLTREAGRHRRTTMADENTTPRADLERSRGELTEGRPHPTKDIPAGYYATEK
jgi:hypothetical protein